MNQPDFQRIQTIRFFQSLLHAPVHVTWAAQLSLRDPPETLNVCQGTHTVGPIPPSSTYQHSHVYFISSGACVQGCSLFLLAAAKANSEPFCTTELQCTHNVFKSLLESLTCAQGGSSVPAASAEAWNESQCIHTVWTNQPSSAEIALRFLLVTSYVVPLKIS